MHRKRIKLLKSSPFMGYCALSSEEEQWPSKPRGRGSSPLERR
jgi:hypothetical protein